MPIPDTDKQSVHSDKHKLYHTARGSRVLADATQEKLAYLLSDPRTERDYERLLGVTDEQVAKFKEDFVFARRLAYLTKKNNRPKVKKPQSPEQYRDWALRKLYTIASKAKHDKDKVSACKVLGIIAGELAKTRPQEPDDTADGLDDLKKAFGGGNS